jgi:hypothetical protein
MAIYDDLRPCAYFERWDDVLVSVGWLGTDTLYPKGKVSEDVFASLASCLADPWQPVTLAGRYPCPFCRFTGGPSQMTFREWTIQLGSSNLFVPGDNFAYVAPSLIVHYIDAHEYSPPAEFQRAVLDCPRIKSVAYMKRMKEIGIR